MPLSLICNWESSPATDSGRGASLPIEPDGGDVRHQRSMMRKLRRRFAKKSQFVFERPLSAQSIRKTLKPAYGLILRERRRYFRCSGLYSCHHPEGKRGRRFACNSVNISGGGMALSTQVPLVRRRKRPRAVHSARSRRTILGRINDLLVENGPSGSSLRVHF